jgi:uncharacterized protein
VRRPALRDVASTRVRDHRRPGAMSRTPAQGTEKHQAVSDLATLLRTLQPHLNSGVYVYTQIPLERDIAGMDTIATMREREGITLILREEEAQRHALPVLFRAAWITLTVHSDLQAVGLTAAFSHALADAGIGCNVIAGANHDHVFVPVEHAQRALETLCALQAAAVQNPSGT